MRVQTRDKEMLNAISELGLISTKQVRHLFFTDDVAMTMVLKRLRFLEKRTAY